MRRICFSSRLPQQLRKTLSTACRDYYQYNRNSSPLRGFSTRSCACSHVDLSEVNRCVTVDNPGLVRLTKSGALFNTHNQQSFVYNCVAIREAAISELFLNSYSVLTNNKLITQLNQNRVIVNQDLSALENDCSAQCTLAEYPPLKPLIASLQNQCNMADNKYLCDYARLGTSSCKKCKQKLPKGGLRMAKVVPNPFTDEGGEMKQYHHASCLFETFIRARATTKIIQEDDDVEGFENLEADDKEMIRKLIKGMWGL